MEEGYNEGGRERRDTMKGGRDGRRRDIMKGVERGGIQ